MPTIDFGAAWFGYDDLAGLPGVSVTTSDMDIDEASAGPVAHVLDRYTYRVWIAPSTNEWFEIDFGKDVTAQAFAVVFPRITNRLRSLQPQEIQPTDTVRHYLDADGGTPGTGAVCDTGAIACGARPDRGYSLTALESEVTFRTWRCEINAASRTDEAFFNLAMGMCAPIFQPEFNHIYGDTLEFADNSEITRTDTSQVGFVARYLRTLAARLTFDFIQDAALPQWDEFTDYSGLTEPILYARPTKDAVAFTSLTGPNGHVWPGDECFIGNLTSGLSRQTRQLNTNVKTLQLTEHR